MIILGMLRRCISMMPKFTGIHTPPYGLRFTSLRGVTPSRKIIYYPTQTHAIAEMQIRSKITTNQMIRKPPFKKKKRYRYKMLEGKPMRKGIVTRLIVMKPKKPNSAQRKMCKVMLKNGREVICGIPGIGHNLREHSEVIFRAGRTQDCPGAKYKVVRGLLDCQGVSGRTTSRSKYGTKKPKEKV